MDYQEALGVLGLEDGASSEEVKTAYREMAQILHPDRFTDNRRLAARAEEQFKRLNQARDLLLEQPGRAGARRPGAAAGSPGAAAAARSGAAARRPGAADPAAARRPAADPASELKARLAGIAAARAQLTAQLDADLDSRRQALWMAAIGFLALFFGERLGMRVAASLGGTVLIWGVIRAFAVQPRIRTLREHLDDLAKQRKQCEAELKKL